MVCDCGTIPKDYIHSCGCSIEILSSQGETCLSFGHPKKSGSETDCFPSFCFLGLLQLLTQKVKMSEPYKTILWLIKFQLEGQKNHFPFFSIRKRSDRIKFDRTALYSIQPGQFAVAPCFLQRRSLKSKITMSQSVRNRSQKRKHWQLGDCVLRLLLPNPERRRCFLFSFFSFKKKKKRKTNPQRKHMGAKHAAHSSRSNQTHEKQDFLFLLQSHCHKINKAQLMLLMGF